MKYKFVGDGAGVPGLAHVITDAEAEALGVTELLKEAIANGNYVADSSDASTKQPKKQKEESVGE